MASKQDSTGGTTPTKGKAVQVVAGVGGVRSSEEAVPDLWFGQNTEERRDATCSAGWRRNSELVTAHQGYKRQESSGIAIPHWRYRPLVGIERNPESRMRKKPPVRFDEGRGRTVMGLCACQSVPLPTLHTIQLSLSACQWV